MFARYNDSMLCPHSKNRQITKVLCPENLGSKNVNSELIPKGLFLGQH
jgi:hypothetical protein